MLTHVHVFFPLLISASVIIPCLHKKNDVYLVEDLVWIWLLVLTFFFFFYTKTTVFYKKKKQTTHIKKPKQLIQRWEVWKTKFCH